MGTFARKTVNHLVLLVGALLLASPAPAQDSLPQETEDGLVRVDSKNVGVLYWRPGATLEPFERVALLDAYVAFRQNWQRDQNRGRGVNQVTASDMERMRTALAEAFREEFTQELEERGGYEIVDVVGDDVLLLRPAIVNLDVAAPDLQTAQRTRSYVATAGEMTLYMELYDGATNELIGRAIDRRVGRETVGFQISNSVTNRAEANRILQDWAGTLRNALDERWSGR